MPIIDSGERRTFDSGAVRDIQESKGRCDLLPLIAVGNLISCIDGEMYKFIFNTLDCYLRVGNAENLLDVICAFAKATNTDICTLLLSVSRHYEEGCRKYGERNWEKGIPIYCYIDSAVRHLLKYIRLDQDERHDRAFVWNILGAYWTHLVMPDNFKERLPFFEFQQQEAAAGRPDA